MLVTGTTVVNGTIGVILKVAGAKAVFYGISIVGVARLLDLERFCPRSMWGVFLLSLIFYKICTKIIHKLYVELWLRLVCMGCGEPYHNRHTVSIMTDCVVVLPKVSRTRKRYVQAPYLSPGFGD